MEFQEDHIRGRNRLAISQLMDTIWFFKDRIDSISSTDGDTIIRISGIRRGFEDDQEDSGEMRILADLIDVQFEGLYRGNYMTGGICRLVVCEPVLTDDLYNSSLDLVLALDPVHSFPLHEQALQEVKKQLAELAEKIGKR